MPFRRKSIAREKPACDDPSPIGIGPESPFLLLRRLRPETGRRRRSGTDSPDHRVAKVGRTKERQRCRSGENPLHVKNLHATILHQLGLDPNHLSYFYGGLDQKLVGVEEVEPIHQIIA
ncbi:hypothetical protein FF011L_41520 [Roseimaritima multifibrata]|uniref:DUF1501 domain-containing protein n=1 Tax=Roseimaritima multifibrata TaxID=1930274 RepID=A0A517MKF1_9BACT|nr:hypothetical protein FF011L_41520 [Roseimaritima multifibrata]